jgi:hypothetical protein
MHSKEPSTTTIPESHQMLCYLGFKFQALFIDFNSMNCLIGSFWVPLSIYSSLKWSGKHEVCSLFLTTFWKFRTFYKHFVLCYILLTDLNLVLLLTVALWSGICWMELMYEQVHRCTCHGCLSAPAELQSKVFAVYFSPIVDHIYINSKVWSLISPYLYLNHFFFTPP